MNGYAKCARKLRYLERWCEVMEKAIGISSAGMNDNVEELDKYRPRLYVTVDGEEMEYPLRLIVGWAAGTHPLPEEKVIRFIILEWIANIAGFKLGSQDYE